MLSDDIMEDASGLDAPEARESSARRPRGRNTRMRECI